MLIEAIGGGLAVAGAIQSIVGGQKQANIQNKQFRLSQQISAQSQRAEAVRNAQARSDFRSAQLRIIQEAQAARSLALSNATTQGVGTQGSTFGGAVGQIAGQVSQQLGDLRGNFARGQQIFKINAEASRLQGQINVLGGQSNRVQRDINDGNALFKLGTSVIGNSTQIGNTFSGIRNALGPQ
jgi:hypothetical protein